MADTSQLTCKSTWSLHTDEAWVSVLVFPVRKNVNDCAIILMLDAWNKEVTVLIVMQRDKRSS